MSAITTSSSVVYLTIVMILFGVYNRAFTSGNLQFLFLFIAQYNRNGEYK